MNYKIPLIKSSMPGYEEYCETIKEIWSSGRMSDNGILFTKLKKQLMALLDTKNLLLFSNGHSALECALHALPTKGEIITTPFTFASTTHAIVHSGFEPVFCDIDPKTMTIDASLIEGLISDRTVAILGVHVYGIPCNVYEIERIAKKYGLYVLYDAAHSFGTKYDEIDICNFGDISMFSFHSTKVFNTAEGGALCSHQDAIMDRAKRFRYFGFISKEDADVVGFNAKMSEFHAAMGLCNLRHLSEYILKRKRCSDTYDSRLSKLSCIDFPQYPSNLKRNYSYYPIILNEKSCISRDDLCNLLEKEGIQTRKYFYPLTTTFSCYNHKYDCYKLPVSQFIADNILCLPLHSELSIEDVDYICDCMIDILGPDNYV